MTLAVFDRPISLRSRPDLRARAMPSRFGEYWTVQDPLSLRFYRLRPEEYFILQSLDGRRSLAELKRLFERQFAPRQVMAQQLQAFLAMLHGEGLILADAEGQGEVLLKRRQAARRHQLWRELGNPLAIRLRGVNPDRFLQWLLSKCGWLFSPVVLCLAGLLVLSAIVLLWTEWTTVLTKVAALPSRLRTADAVWFVLAVCVSKVFHEIGHALTCKRLGRRCHELGVMFLVFVPCLYCNVSDAWFLPSKWQRMAVTAAGMVVELVLAAACLWVWWCTASGLLNSFCLAMAIVCSVNTLLINGNPLLRFDGYYLLADYLEIPNLSQAAQHACGLYWDRVWLGPHTPRPLSVLNLEPKLLLVGYGIASVVYRWVVLLVIVGALYRALDPRGLAVLGHALTLLLLITVVVVPFYRGVKTGLDRASGGGPAGVWRGFILMVVLLAAVGLLCMPVVHRVEVPVHIEGQAAERVYVTMPGFLRPLVAEAATVRQGQVLARLENFEFELAVRTLRAQYDEQELYVSNLRRLRSLVEDIDAELSAAEATLKDLRDRLRQRENQQRQLTLAAPRAGVILPAPIQPARATTDELGGWDGKPLDEHNVGAYLAKGTWFCSVGDPHRVEAIALIEQGQIQRLDVGQPVRLRLDQLPEQVIRGTLVELAEADLTRDTPWWSGSPESGGVDRLPAPEHRDAKLIPGATYYKARISLEGFGQPPRIGSGGRAKITVSAESLATGCYRYLRRNFSFLQ